MLLRLDGRTVSIRTKGTRWDDGRPVLLCIHGAGGNGTHWLGQLRGLSADFHLLLVDLPGHGKSEGPGKVSVAGYRDWLREVLLLLAPRVDPDRIILVGHSLGGAIAMDYVLHGYPAAGLVLISTGARMRVSKRILDVLADGDSEAWAQAAVGLMFGIHASQSLRDLSRKELAATPLPLYRTDFQAADAWDAMDRVGDIAIPTQVISGTNDMMTPPKYARYLSDTIPGSRLRMLEAAGHMPMLEDAEAVNETLRQFVNTLADSNMETEFPAEPGHERPFIPHRSVFEGDPK